MILLLLHCSSTAPGGQQTQNMQTAGPNTPSSKIQSLLLTWVLWCIFLFTPPTLPGDPLCARCCTQPCHSCWYTEKGNEEELDNSHLNKWSRAIPGVSAAEYRAARAYEGSGETHTTNSMLFPFLSFTTLAQSQVCNAGIYSWSMNKLHRKVEISPGKKGEWWQDLRKETDHWTNPQQCSSVAKSTCTCKPAARNSYKSHFKYKYVKILLFLIC